MSFLMHTFRTAGMLLPRLHIKTSCGLHQIASRLTAIPVHPVKEIAPGSSVISCGSLSPPASIGCGWFTQSVRHKIRNYYPRPREHKRHKYTWWGRMETRGGRMVLMRRIIKRAHIIAHPI